MTCIVGLVHCGKVYMGADSSGVSNWELEIRADEKLFHNGPCLVGFTTSFRMGQLLRWRLTVPPRRGKLLDCYMATDFVDAVRNCFTANGYIQVKNQVETGGEFLVGIENELFYIGEDFQVGRSQDGYMAIGCGSSVALGALHATAGEPPYVRLRKALQAAEHHNIGVRGPFIYKEL